MIYKNVNITTAREQFLGWLEVDENNLIVQICRGSTEKQGLDFQKNVLLPTFIDSHTHGGYGFAFDKIDEYHDLDTKVAQYQEDLYREGVAGVFLTTVTHEICALTKKAQYYFALLDKYPHLFLKWYLEGPFISKAKKGAHKESYITSLEETKIVQFVPKNKSHQVIFVVAPEYEDNYAQLPKLSQKYQFALGHSNAINLPNLKQFDTHFARTTHMYNAMSGFDYRNETIVSSILEKEKIQNGHLVEIIGDGIHVKNATLKFTYKNIAVDNLIVVSDSLPAKGLENGHYDLGDLEIVKEDFIFKLSDLSAIAGSAMPYNYVLKNFYEATGCSWSEIVKVSSYNVAQSLNIQNHFGTIEIGKQANFIIIDKNSFDVLHVHSFNKIKTFVDKNFI